MAQTISKISESQVINQFDTYNHTALRNSMYMVKIRMTDIPASGISILMKQNSTTKASFSSPTPGQSAIDLDVIMNCSINDVIGVVISSSTASDQLGNSFKAILTIRQGSF